jgi:transcriptional regulator with XRE-family HTH domain
MADFDLGGKIRAWRLELGRSQREFAELVGVAPSAVSQWEGGVNHPPFATLERVAQACGVSVAVFLAFEPSGRVVPRLEQESDRDGADK